MSQEPFTLSKSVGKKRTIDVEKEKFEKEVKQKTENLSKLEKEIVSITGKMGDERIVVCAKANGREQFHCKIVEEPGKEPQFVPMYDKTFEYIGEAVKWGEKIIATSLKNGLIDVNTGDTIHPSDSMITIIASNDPDYLAIEKDNQQFLLSQNGKFIRFPYSRDESLITFEHRDKIKIFSNSKGEKFLVCKDPGDRIKENAYKIKNDERIIPIFPKTPKRGIEINYQFKDWILYTIRSDGAIYHKMYNTSTDKTYDRPEEVSDFGWRISAAIESQKEEKEIMCVAEPYSSDPYKKGLYALKFSDEFEMKKIFVDNRCKIINNNFILIATKDGNDEVHVLCNRDNVNRNNWIEILKIKRIVYPPSYESEDKIIFVSDGKETYIINKNTGKIVKKLPFYATISRDDLKESDTPNITARIGDTLITYNYDMDHIINIAREE